MRNKQFLSKLEFHLYLLYQMSAIHVFKMRIKTDNNLQKELFKMKLTNSMLIYVILGLILRSFENPEA